MQRDYYIFKCGEIKRKDNTITIITEENIKKDIPIETVDNLYIFGEETLNTSLLSYISSYSISLHFFNYYGFYTGSFIPRTKNLSGYSIVKQVEHFIDNNKKLYLAKEFIEAGSYNIYRNLRYYNQRGVNLEDLISEIKFLRNSINNVKSVEELMGIEGNIRKQYYSSWNKIVKQEINFEKRVKRPPDNMINSLISFINTMIYTTVLSEIFKTQLNPTISYLHVPGEKRYSLSLDISEIFKPLIADRMIFSLLNKNIITEKDFDSESNFLYLKDKARIKIIKEYDERLKKTIKHKELNKSVSYKYLIRLEAYKLIKHFTGEKEYKGFKIWW
ncbi:type I-B CRISPR-associated endonuclease Cas1b [Helcococcus kunzii]|uniref:type I-B CRISPR-associated endonuclease Cas1b n=1 Tax=Helcococcus kunzii TaxID=40091 RepID=UPI0024AD1D8C|nr:type I-B CRISPR-associated endonuclease Cas1b [Helcococcus kunzii]